MPILTVEHHFHHNSGPERPFAFIRFLFAIDPAACLSWESKRKWSDLPGISQEIESPPRSFPVSRMRQTSHYSLQPTSQTPLRKCNIKRRTKIVVVHWTKIMSTSWKCCNLFFSKSSKYDCHTRAQRFLHQRPELKTRLENSPKGKNMPLKQSEKECTNVRRGRIRFISLFYKEQNKYGRSCEKPRSSERGTFIKQEIKLTSSCILSVGCSIEQSLEPR